MGATFSGDNRLGYTHGGVDSYWNWAKAKKEFRVFLKNYPYFSPGSDMLKYQGCVSFDGHGPLNDPPCYSLWFEAGDADLRNAIARQLAALKRKLGFIEGPVSVFIYRDYNHLGNGKSWFSRNGKDYGRFINEFRGIPLQVQVILPSITKDGERAPNYAFLGRTHRWATDFIFVPHTSVYTNWMMQCYTYCADEYGRFFPCGCSWKGECEAKPAGEKGILDTTAKRTIFYGAYTVDLHHPQVSDLFRAAQYRNYYLNVLPMDMDMFSNCRYALVSQNSLYSFDVNLSAGTVYRKGPPGKKRVCEKRGWWIFSRIVCWDEWYPGWDFRTACRFGESKKYSLRDCNDSNGMCAGETNGIDGSMQGEHFPKNGWHTYYAIHHHRNGNDMVNWVLEEDHLKALSHGGNKEVIWEWSFKHIPVDIRVGPLALVLTDKGELVLYNGRNQRIASVTKGAAHYDVNKDDDGQGDDEDDPDYKRMMEALNHDAWRKRQGDAENAMLKNLVDLRESGRDNDSCPAPPFAFL